MSQLSQLCRKSAWIFDLDDTLFPEIDFVFSGYRAVSQKVFDDYGVDIEPLLRHKFVQGQRGDLFTPSLVDMGVHPGEPYVKSLVETYRAHHPDIALFVDADRLLAVLSEHGVSVGIISDGWQRVQANKIGALGLRARVDGLVLTDAIDGQSTWKPDVAGYEACLNELGADPDEAVFVGDNPTKDFLGAGRAGIDSIRVRRPLTEHADADAQGARAADAEISSFAEILQLSFFPSHGT